MLHHFFSLLKYADTLIGKYSLSLTPDIKGHGYGGEKDTVSDRDTDV